MSVSHFPPRDPGPRRDAGASPDPLALAPEDCGRGHACQFCPEEPSCRLEKGHHEKRLLETRLGQIGQIIMVMANKGGVGKSTVSANVAAGLAARGYRVGVADADIHGPNQSRFFGFVGDRVRLGQYGLTPRAFTAPEVEHPVKVGSLAFMMETDEAPIVWRDAYKHDFMHHLVGSFDWGPLDFLVIDMPPGTGNELITLADLLEGHDVAALLATTPQEVALMDSLKAVRFCQERGLPLLGVVENMAGHAEIGDYARELGIDFLGTCGEAARAASLAFGAGGCHFDEREALVRHALNHLPPGASVLVKGSRSAAMEQVVAVLRRDRSR